MLITLTTDFGTSSPYVAALKGSLLSVCRDVELVDLTHGISPQNVRQAAVVLADVTPFFPSGTLHVVVVDPGVGTERKLIYAEIAEQKYLAPDNGVLSYLARSTPPRSIVELAERSYWRANISETFHGRDVLAPVAGHLAAGLSPTLLGPELKQFVQLAWAEPEFGSYVVRGEVLLVDSFGNLITNLLLRDLKNWSRGEVVTSVGGQEISGIQTTYGRAAAGELITLGDSQGRFEIAQVNGNAAHTLGVLVGDLVQVFRAAPRPAQS